MLVGIGALFTGLLVPGACAAHALAARQPIPPAATVGIVVLGYPTRRNGAPHPLQAWRSRLAVDTADAHGATAVIFTGRGRSGGPSEAKVMADLAGLRAPLAILEEASTSTWENVSNAAPWVRAADVVVIVSDPLHAARARRYWLKQNPADSNRVFVTDQSTFWDHWWLKVPTAIDAIGRAVLNGLSPHPAMHPDPLPWRNERRSISE